MTRKLLASLFALALLLAPAAALAAVSSTYAPPQYAGNGAVAAFSFPYPYFEPQDLQVTLFNTGTNQVVTPAPQLNGGNTYDYTVNGIQAFSSSPSNNVSEWASATITFNNPPPGGYEITITRAVPQTQLLNLLDNGKFTSQTVNSEFDKLTLLVQQLSAQVAAAYQNPPIDPTGLTIVAPPAPVRASQYACWDSSGNFTSCAPSSGVVVSTPMAPVVGASSLAVALNDLSPLLANIATASWAQGDLLYYTGSALVPLAPGTPGQALTTQGGGANPAWQGVPAVVGQMRNLVGTTPSSTTLKYTADEVVAEDVLGGTPSKVSFPSSGSGLTLNAGTTGAGGMDTGSQPTSGFLAVYLVTKPNGQSPALLGTVASSSTGSIYGAGHMPSGYTQSALVGYWPCGSGPAFVAGTQLDRKFVYGAPASVFSGTSSPSSLTAQSLSAVVPYLAKTVSGVLGFTGSGSGATDMLAVASSSGGADLQEAFTQHTSFAAQGFYGEMTFRDLPLLSPQSLDWQADSSGISSGLVVTDFTF